jgi:hypothetical protein
MQIVRGRYFALALARDHREHQVVALVCVVEYHRQHMQDNYRQQPVEGLVVQMGKMPSGAEADIAG